MNNYDDIINILHYEPKHHPRMSMYNRAAQFAPFAALSGYDDLVKETGRLTDNKIILDENRAIELNEKILKINNIINTIPEVEIIYFVKDLKKQGGKYLKFKGNLRRIDFTNRILQFENNKNIKMDDISNIKCSKLKI